VRSDSNLAYLALRSAFSLRPDLDLLAFRAAFLATVRAALALASAARRDLCAGLSLCISLWFFKGFALWPK